MTMHLVYETSWWKYQSHTVLKKLYRLLLEKTLEMEYIIRCKYFCCVYVLLLPEEDSCLILITRQMLQHLGQAWWCMQIYYSVEILSVQKHPQLQFLATGLICVTFAITHYFSWKIVLQVFVLFCKNLWEAHTLAYHMHIASYPLHYFCIKTF